VAYGAQSFVLFPVAKIIRFEKVTLYHMTDVNVSQQQVFYHPVLYLSAFQPILYFYFLFFNIFSIYYLMNINIIFMFVS